MSFDITLTDGTHTAQGWTTGESIIPSGGYGGHPSAPRPKRAALTLYEGRSPFQLVVPLLLYRGGASIERDRVALETMATSAGEHETQRPPGVTLTALFPLPVPHAISGGEWWIEDLGWGEEHRNAPTASVDPGHKTWNLVSVTLLERIDDETIGGGSAPSGLPKVKTNRAHKYQVKKGDTLHSIAKSQLGNATRWQEIAKLNGIRSDGQLHAKIGKFIKIPATTSQGWAQPTSK